MGLAISRQLCELMGGSLWAESEGVPGKGSTFHFTMGVQATAERRQLILHPDPPQLVGKRLLIVDDSAR